MYRDIEIERVEVRVNPGGKPAGYGYGRLGKVSIR